MIERASLPEQHCVAGSLQALPALALLHGVKPPALIMIGTVVSLHADLAQTSASPEQQRVAV